MKIPLYYDPRIRYWRFLYIEKKYQSNVEIVPIGCDCHPAYMLQSLRIRNKSLPFDWLNTEPKFALEYVSENLLHKFEKYLANLTRNQNGNVISANYPYAEFIHEPHLPEDQIAQERMSRRAKRFLDVTKSNPVAFLHMIPADAFQDKESLDRYISSITGFIQNLEPRQALYVYIRFDENDRENDEVISILEQKLLEYNVRSCRYVRNLSDFGLWGNPAQYVSLFKKLRIKIKHTFPKIHIQ
ncbi:DUF1796 family putative cysteine peptidase [Flavobacterium silvaticum]|uniref:Uncharacterized protein n=1 Tax=Flavobacterium silvaticum TaxID=1852020 RepID=A0A972JFB2_9FLAO|nr:DUF1796 family putative cysteine peptidase [Flavobacterium silvaticum]NMH27041.1 hypothetical protein [Flavobacterium silvaticum]